jgi:hypothetical protein
MQDFFDPSDMPFGLGVALTENPDASRHFCSLPKPEQQAIVTSAHAIKSKEEMSAYVRSLVR